MPDTMDWPATWQEFIKSYSFKDKDEVYTNGSELISVMRVEQMVQQYFENHETQKVELFNYKDEKVMVDIGELKDIYLIEMDVISGDERLTVFYNDGSIKYFDADENNCRTEDYYDDNYVVYMPNKGNLFKNTVWLNRDNAYDTRWVDSISTFK